MACADKAHKVEGDGGARACFRMPHSRSRYIDPGRPPAADGGLRSQYPDLVLGARQLLDCRPISPLPGCCQVAGSCRPGCCRVAG